MMRWQRLILIAFCAGWLSGLPAQSVEPAPETADSITVDTVLGWIERYQRIDADNAELLRQSLDRRADRVARLELAVLEIYAPLPVAAPARGLERLGVLLDTPDDPAGSAWITLEAQRMLALFLNQLQSVQSFQQQADVSADRLERERRAHLDTLEKLDALRSIERDLEQRQSGEDEAASEDGEDQEDNPNPARQRR